MSIDHVQQILCTKDGALPDINFDFGESRVAADAYALLQRRANCLISTNSYYWSKSEDKEIPIRFGENPALNLLNGEADGFHVVFGGMRSASGAPIPDIGVFVPKVGFIGLDYQMGPEWNNAAVLGLFELMRDLTRLSGTVKVTHEGNIFESEHGILLSEFNEWMAANGQEK